MTSERTLPPEPAGGPEPTPRILVHPLVLLGWPGYALRIAGSRPPRRRLVRRRRRKRAR